MTIAKITKTIVGSIGRTFVWVSTLAVLLLCLLFARTLYAPVNLDFAKETVLSSAQDFLPGWNVSYTSAELGWDWRHVRPWLKVEGLSLVDRRERLRVNVPSVQAGFSIAGVFHKTALSTLEFEGASFYVADLAGFSDETDDSALADLFKFEGFPKPRVFKPVAEAFSRFSLRLLENAPHLESLIFDKNKVVLVLGGGLNDITVTIPTVRLIREGDDLALSAQFDAYLADQPIRGKIKGRAQPDIGDLALNVSVSNIDLADLAKDFKFPEVVGYLAVPLGISLDFDLSSDVGLRTANFDISIGEGSLLDPIAYPGGAPIKYGSLSGYFDAAEEILSVDEIALSTGKRLVSGNGSIYWENVDGEPTINVSLSTPEVTVAEVLEYWPIKTYPDGTERGARVWVAGNMDGSGVTKNIKFALERKPDGSTPFLDDSLYQLTFDIVNTNTAYLQDMPHLENVTGKAVLTRTAFVVDIDRGTVLGLPINGSRASMTNINVPNEGVGVFDVNVTGPVQTILKIVDTPPVSISERLNIDINRLGGQAEVMAEITVPLVKGPAKDDVRYSVQASVSDTVVKGLLGGEGLTEADILLNLDNDILTTEGSGLLNGVSLDLYWRENFKAGRDNPVADTSFMVISGSVDEKDMGALGVDVSKYLHGKAFGEASFLGRNLKFRVGYFSADASYSELAVPEIGWQKPINVPASVTGTLNLSDTGASIEPLVVHGENIDVTANMQFGGKNSGIFSLDANAVQLGRAKNMSAVVTSDGQNPLRADIRAETFDFAPLLKSKRDETGENLETPQSGFETVTPSFHLTLSADRFLMLNGVAYLDASVDLDFENGEPKRLNFSATDMLGQTEMHIAPGGDSQTLTVTTRDGGSLLRGLALFPHLDKGDLTLEATTKGWGDSLSIDGRLKIKDSLLVAQKALSSDVDTGVISGLDGYLEDNTMTMDIVDMPFTYNGTLLDITNLKANGPSMGMTMEGQIDAAAGKINVNGVVVPAYGLNSILGNIPIIGGVFTGGDGKGLFGVTYRVKGMTTEPKVTVNPLSGLAPGFLRNLFEGRKGKVSRVKDPVTPADKTETAPTLEEPDAADDVYDPKAESDKQP